MATAPAPDLLLSVDLTGFLIALETRIQAALPMGWGEAQCRITQGRLVVGWWRSISDPLPTTPECLTTLTQAIQSALWETELPESLFLSQGSLPIHLYWQYRGQSHPAAAWIWHWRPGDALESLFDFPGKGGQPDLRDSLVAIPTTDCAPVPHPTVLPRGDHPSDPVTKESSAPYRPPSIPSIPTDIPLGDTLRPTVSKPSAGWGHLWQPWGLLIALGLGLGGTGYWLTRPCVMGGCERQDMAYDLSQGAITQLQPDATGREVLAAYEDLRQAVRLLAAVPPWSPHYSAVQADLTRYQTHLGDLEWILTAQTLGLGASEVSQSPPYAVSHWRQVYGDWQRAIAALDRISDASPFAPLRNTKRLEYLANYQAIGDRMAAERTAELNLNQALRLAQSATTQASQANDLLTWDTARQDWQGAVDALARIPRGTLAHRDARTLAPTYRENLATARTQVIQQQAGEFAHRRAVAAVAAARQAETQDQWTQAVSEWRQAIAALEQIPDNTAHSSDMAERLTIYRSALAIAQDNLRQAVLLQEALEVLSPLCPEQGDRCRVAILNQRLILQLQPPYDLALIQSLTPPVTGTPVPLAIPVRTFLQELTNLLDRLPTPTPIQNAAGQPLGEYHPDHGGYIR